MLKTLLINKKATGFLQWEDTHRSLHSTLCGVHASMSKFTNFSNCKDFPQQGPTQTLSTELVISGRQVETSLSAVTLLISDQTSGQLSSCPARNILYFVSLCDKIYNIYSTLHIHHCHKDENIVTRGVLGSCQLCHHTDNLFVSSFVFGFHIYKCAKAFSPVVAGVWRLKAACGWHHLTSPPHPPPNIEILKWSLVVRIHRVTGGPCFFQLGGPLMA